MCFTTAHIYSGTPVFRNVGKKGVILGQKRVILVEVWQLYRLYTFYALLNGSLIVRHGGLHTCRLIEVYSSSMSGGRIQ